LSSARIHSGNFQGTSLQKTNLLYAQLWRTDLAGADFAFAVMGDTVLSELDLSAVHGLEQVEHRAPSVISVDTMVRSGGSIPQEFLRGCGLPDRFIDFLPALLQPPLQSCFISYSTEDQEFAERLHTDLQNEGVRCWFAPKNLQGGKKLYEQIDQAIKVHDRLLLILSADSMGSKWVKTEIAKARRKEIEQGRRALFPVRVVEFDEIQKWECFDADTCTDSARDVREYFIPDFSNWKDHAAYRKAFDRLLRDLKDEGTGSPA
jgi:hypothetical protein